MTTEDKTGDKLVASIRKTKAGAAGNDQADPAKPSTPATRKKTAARRAPTKTESARSESGGGQYQSEGRVWPD
jgi:hypothetical protein